MARESTTLLEDPASFFVDGRNVHPLKLKTHVFFQDKADSSVLNAFMRNQSGRLNMTFFN